MSMPSDATADVTEAVERVSRPEAPADAPRSALSVPQKGLIAAALVAFVGIAYLGPAYARMTRAPTPRERLARRLRQARWDAEKAGARVRKRVSRLGEGLSRRR